MTWTRLGSKVAFGVAFGMCATTGAVALFQPAAPAFAATCGDPGLPPCPLQSFMRNKVAAPLAQREMAGLASALDRAGTMQPDKAWASWGTFASAGAAAARRNDVEAVRAACKACHDAWRPAYRKDYRLRPLP